MTNPTPSAPISLAREQPAAIYPSNYLSSRVLRFWAASGQQVEANWWLTGPGSFSYTWPMQYTYPTGAVSAQWPVSGYQWLDNTLYQYQYDHYEWGSSAAGCQFSSQSNSTGVISTVHNGCNAMWVRSHFNVVQHAVYSTLSATVSGETQIVVPVTYTWTANPSGGSGLYWFAWHKSTNNGATWSAVCGTSQHCSLAVTPGTTFRLRASVQSTGPNDWYGYNTYAYPTIDVSVAAAAPPLQAWIVGPWNIDPNYGGTWSVGTSGGYEPKSYSWTFNGGWAGNGWSMSQSGLSPSTQYEVGLTVTDAAGTSVPVYITVYTNTGTCPPGSPPDCAEYMKVPGKEKAPMKPTTIKKRRVIR